MALDFPSSPTNGQVYGNFVYSSAKGAWQAKPITGKVTTSATAPSAPTNGDEWFNTNDGNIYVYYTDVDGSQWVQVKSDATLSSTLGNRVEALEAKPSGLVPIVPSSISVSGGTGTVDSSGLITISATAAVNINNLFTSSYKSYKAVFNLRNSTNAEMYFRFRKAGVDTTTGYYGAAWLAYYTSSSGVGNPRSNGNGAWVGYAGSETNISAADIAPLNNDPAISVTGFMRPLGATFNAGYGATISGGVDGFSLFPSTGTVSGTIQVYGYR